MSAPAPLLTKAKLRAKHFKASLSLSSACCYSKCPFFPASYIWGELKRFIKCETTTLVFTRYNPDICQIKQPHPITMATIKSEIFAPIYNVNTTRHHKTPDIDPNEIFPTYIALLCLGPQMRKTCYILKPTYGAQ